MGWYRKVLHISFALWHMWICCASTLYMCFLCYFLPLSVNTLINPHPEIWKQFQRRKVNGTAKLLAHYHGARRRHQVSRMGLGRLLLG